MLKLSGCEDREEGRKEGRISQSISPLPCVLDAVPLSLPPCFAFAHYLAWVEPYLDDGGLDGRLEHRVGQGCAVHADENGGGHHLLELLLLRGGGGREGRSKGE